MRAKEKGVRRIKGKRAPKNGKRKVGEGGEKKERGREDVVGGAKKNMDVRGGGAEVRLDWIAKGRE